MPTMENAQSAWEIESATLAALPLQARTQRSVPTHQLQTHIGITTLTHRKPLGVVKYLPTDFVVEEETIDGDRVRVDEPVECDREAYGQHLAARFTKCGMLSTLHAVHELAQLYTIPLEHIHYAGVKDERALTAQRIVLEGVRIEDLERVHSPHVRVEPLTYTNEVLHHGELTGNHFSILVRTQQPLSQEWLDAMVRWLNQHGVINFYGPQRFYEPRCISHLLGRLLFQGKYDEALKGLFLLPSPFEPRIIADIRKRLSGCYGRYADMERLLLPYPHSFSVELRAIEALKQGLTTLDVLNSIGDQVHYWALAYTSFLANEWLSQCVTKKQQLPEELPLLLSASRWTWETYKKQLFRDGTQGYIENVKKISSIRMSASPRISTTVHPQGLRAVAVPQGAVFEFSLPKGAYATTVLSYFFDLTTPPPLPRWISSERVDVKRVLGTGSLERLSTYFADDIAGVERLHKYILTQE